MEGKWYYVGMVLVGAFIVVLLIVNWTACSCRYNECSGTWDHIRGIFDALSLCWGQ